MGEDGFFRRIQGLRDMGVSVYLRNVGGCEWKCSSWINYNQIRGFLEISSPTRIIKIFRKGTISFISSSEGQDSPLKEDVRDSFYGDLLKEYKVIKPLYEAKLISLIKTLKVRDENRA